MQEEKGQEETLQVLLLEIQRVPNRLPLRLHGQTNQSRHPEVQAQLCPNGFFRSQSKQPFLARSQNLEQRQKGNRKVNAEHSRVEPPEETGRHPQFHEHPLLRHQPERNVGRREAPPDRRGVEEREQL